MSHPVKEVGTKHKAATPNISSSPQWEIGGTFSFSAWGERQLDKYYYCWIVHHQIVHTYSLRFYFDLKSFLIVRHLKNLPCWIWAGPCSEMTRGKILTESMTLSDRELHCSICSIMQLFTLFMPSLIFNTWPKTYQNSKSHASAYN